MIEEAKKFVDWLLNQLDYRIKKGLLPVELSEEATLKIIDIINTQAKRIEELEKAIRDVRDTLSEELYLVKSGLEVGARPSPNGIICTLEKAVKKLNKGAK